MEKDFKQKHIKILKGLGLTDNQVKIYFVCLKRGLISALEISRETGINRQQVYSETEALVKKGILDITRKHRKKYIPANPRALLHIGKREIASMEDTLVKIESIIPELEDILAPSKHKVATRYYEGINKIKEAYEKELDECVNTIIYSLVGSMDDILKFFPEKYWDKWNKRFVAQGSSSKMLVHNSKAAKQTVKYDKKYNRDTRYLDEFPLKVNIDVFNNTVLIVSFYDEMAIWIDSDVLADSYRLIFKTLWANSNKFE